MGGNSLRDGGRGARDLHVRLGSVLGEIGGSGQSDMVS